MSTPATTSTRRGWEYGLVMFAGAFMLISGLLQFIRGLVALFENTVYVNTPKYAFSFDVTTWGWLHLVWGLVLVAVGAAILAGRMIGRIAGLSIITLAIILNFASMPYYPLWSITLLVLNAFVIWALCAVDAVD